MLDNKHFEEWLDQMADKVMKKVDSKEPVTSDDMLVIVLKSQSNHFSHLDTDLRSEMKNLREDMNERFQFSHEEMKNLREDMEKRFAESREDMEKRFVESREDMNRRFEAVDKRFEVVDKRFVESREDMNRRFEESREDMNRRFAESREDMKLLREDTNRRFVSTQWLIGIGITLMGVLMSLYQFLQQPPPA